MIGVCNLGFSFPGLEKLDEVYQELDEQMRLFKNFTGLDCRSKCRKCCETARTVEASLFEMLPLSIHLWQKGEAEPFLARMRGLNQETPCVLLNPNPPDDQEGSCSYYSLRPLICRLFGFSAVLDKYGKPLIALCRTIKERDPKIEGKMNKMIQEGLQVPIIPHFSRKVAFIHPHLGQVRYPIRYSLKQALEIVGYRMNYMKETEGPIGAEP